MRVPRVFILSPAHCGGERAQLLLRPQANFPLARQLRSRDGSTLGETFSFLSGLYFRGKLTYAAAFANASAPARIRRSSTLVITTNRGLLAPHTRITRDDLVAMGDGEIDPRDACYRQPLERDMAKLARRLGPHGQAVLLGSIASGKYCDILLSFLGQRLLFPQEFIGRGDMSRGGLMLRCVDAMTELTYIPVHGAIRRGSRPPKLERRTRTRSGTADGRR